MDVECASYLKRNEMRIAVVQNDIKKDDTSYNLAHISELINDVEGVDVVLLPEMFHCGFSDV